MTETTLCLRECEVMLAPDGVVSESDINALR